MAHDYTLKPDHLAVINIGVQKVGYSYLDVYECSASHKQSGLPPRFALHAQESERRRNVPLQLGNRIVNAILGSIAHTALNTLPQQHIVRSNG